jgi:hypothetical protein
MGFIRAVREITELDAQIVASSSSEAEAQSFIICKNICPANERLLPARRLARVVLSNACHCFRRRLAP